MDAAMDAPKMTAADRERLTRERVAARRRRSGRLGGIGVALLFLGGVGTILAPEYVVGLIVVMSVGIVLVVAAFLLVRDGVAGLRDLTAK
ncbi:MAG: hypothetical protein A3K59_03690 [Euryarchaeota archaeon RBG_19FT_COMBO_69_17]|nr:MAG: hypothetical protein A3K59_03690 [Euryarchaeota archaeon RBG_19FT_COMBO_69_17]